ncbi:bifunctional folylpolyglutamate synthase/dihydrofolate synthase [Mogibacterium sp. NSJ-24]|jgi:dihydrofolate synthase / folylpolyglutamate synthase|uniref:tetrahydrofolate synthase n=1 Tax=Lentihominibacter hominis TaxID=2763645 RepID=A0A926E6S9_9FIRM|nr:folylpolyglutamate synthase/dihydrofolate synthase family protein [Lentihominibacter hominis]MBC8568402.1 bifunctional folylpolyglutamate synthase/dihydrofolate synthase [Lentihominibacter hominis]
MIDVIDKIHEFNRFGSVLGLERMNILLEKLGDPHKDLRVIHVAGTNGKGSVCKFLEEGLSSCGYNVGLYTSPFIECFNERIRLGGKNISDEDLEGFSMKVLSAAEEMVAEGDDSPTEFEVVTAVALLYFAEKEADIVILEVGLGGKGDSTNVVDKPLICAICSVSYDHMDRLGNTIEEIAADKAGIIKPSVPVISNVDNHAAAAVIARTAYEKESRLYDISDIKPEIFDKSLFRQFVTMEIYGTDYSNVEISMVGRHQSENLKTALSVIEVLRKSGEIKVERSLLYEGLKKAVQPGRFEVLKKGSEETGTPVVIVDGAHNEAGAYALCDTMKENFRDKKILLVTGMLADKQTDKILKAFIDITHDIIVTEPDSPRKLKTDELAAQIRRMGIEPIISDDVEDSVRLAISIWKNYDVVLFAGSLYLIGHVRRMLKDE